VFEDAAYAIYALDPADTVSLVAPQATSVAAVLPGRALPGGDVQSLIGNYTRGLPPVGPVPVAEPYRRSLSLDAIGQPTLSGSMSTYGARFSGGVSALFSDTLGDRGLGMQALIGGSLADIGGEVVYLNRRHRWNWAVSAVAAPQAAGYLVSTRDPDTGDTQVSEVIDRQPVRGVFASTAYPFSMSTRLELSGGAQSLSFTREIRSGVFDPTTRRLTDVVTEHVTVGETMYLGVGRVALVHDTSFYGATSPIYGARSRFEIGRTAGTASYTTALADWRRYFMPVRPVTIAVRGLHFGRYGRDSEHAQLLDVYAGHPEYVHGYGIGSFGAIECLTDSTGAGATGECDVFRSLIGSRMFVANIEVHAPVPGLFRGEIEYGRFPIDVVAFADAGLAWTRHDRPTFFGGGRQLVRSVGAAVRVNVFGLIAVELSAARPLDRLDKGLQWQLGIRQGF
jgi:hypothetical protein